MSRVNLFFKGLFGVNPIIVKEIRSRMRGPRAFITLTLILLLMGGAMFGMLQIILASSRSTNILSPQIGQSLFAALVYLELFMICAITPAVTAGAISAEKEKQTYEMLMATPLSPTSILWGKLISALSYVLLLLFAAVPLASVVFIFGGVTLGSMAKALMVLLGVAIAYGVLGLFLSALFGRTGRATVAAFLMVVFLMVGPLFLAGVTSVITSKEPPRWMLAPSPLSALAAALAPSMGSNSGGDVFFALSGIFNMGVNSVSQVSIPRPLYHYSLPFYVVLSVVLYLLSTRLIQPTRRWRLRWKELLLGIGILLMVIGALGAGFLLTANRYEWAKNPNFGAAAQGMTEPAVAVPAGAMAQKQVVAMPKEWTPTPAASATVVVATETPAKNAALPAEGKLAAFDADTQAQIYAAITRQFYTVDHTFGKTPPNWATLYLVGMTNDAIGDPQAPQGQAASLDKAVREGIAQQVSDLPTKVIWVESEKEVSKNAQNGQVDNDGAIISFGNIYEMKDGSLHVSASLYFASLGGAGKTYVLKEVNGAWKISGTTGREWIS